MDLKVLAFVGKKSKSWKPNCGDLAGCFLHCFVPPRSPSVIKFTNSKGSLAFSVLMIFPQHISMVAWRLDFSSAPHSIPTHQTLKSNFFSLSFWFSLLWNPPPAVSVWVGRALAGEARGEGRPVSCWSHIKAWAQSPQEPSWQTQTPLTESKCTLSLSLARLPAHKILKTLLYAMDAIVLTQLP